MQRRCLLLLLYVGNHLRLRLHRELLLGDNRALRWIPGIVRRRRRRHRHRRRWRDGRRNTDCGVRSSNPGRRDRGDGSVIDGGIWSVTVSRGGIALVRDRITLARDGIAPVRGNFLRYRRDYTLCVIVIVTFVVVVVVMVVWYDRLTIAIETRGDEASLPNFDVMFTFIVVFVVEIVGRDPGMRSLLERESLGRRRVRWSVRRCVRWSVRWSRRLRTGCVWTVLRHPRRLHWTFRR